MNGAGADGIGKDWEMFCGTRGERRVEGLSVYLVLGYLDGGFCWLFVVALEVGSETEEM